MAPRGRPPSAKTLVDRQLGRNKPIIPAGDTFIVPNLSGMSSHPEFIEATGDFIPYTGATTDVDLGNNSLTVGAGGIGDSKYTVYNNTVVAYSFGYDDSSSSYVLSGPDFDGTDTIFTATEAEFDLKANLKVSGDVGFYGGTPVGQPTLASDSLANLLIALRSQNLIA